MGICSSNRIRIINGELFMIKIVKYKLSFWDKIKLKVAEYIGTQPYIIANNKKTNRVDYTSYCHLCITKWGLSRTLMACYYANTRVGFVGWTSTAVPFNRKQHAEN